MSNVTSLSTLGLTSINGTVITVKRSVASHGVLTRCRKIVAEYQKRIDEASSEITIPAARYDADGKLVQDNLDNLRIAKEDLAAVQVNSDKLAEMSDLRDLCTIAIARAIIDTGNLKNPIDRVSIESDPTNEATWPRKTVQTADGAEEEIAVNFWGELQDMERLREWVDSFRARNSV